MLKNVVRIGMVLICLYLLFMLYWGEDYGCVGETSESEERPQTWYKLIYKNFYGRYKRWELKGYATR